VIPRFSQNSLSASQHNCCSFFFFASLNPVQSYSVLSKPKIQEAIRAIGHASRHIYAGCRVQSIEYTVQQTGYSRQGTGYRVYGYGCRVHV